MATPTGRVALITGASAGLGRDYARLFAADGHDVVLVARREDRLLELAGELENAHGIKAHVVVADLTTPSAPQTIFDTVEAAGLAIEFLVNNAGFGATGAFVDSDAQRMLDMIAVNVTALTHLSALFLPSMVERGSGRILNIGSTAGFQPGPYMATYYATKAFVNSFSEALAHEVRGTGVSVTVSCPGPVATEFGAVSGNEKSELFKKGMVASSSEVALHGYRAMKDGHAVVVFGLTNKLSVQALRVAPRRLIRTITGRLNRTA